MSIVNIDTYGKPTSRSILRLVDALERAIDEHGRIDLTVLGVHDLLRVAVYARALHPQLLSLARTAEGVLEERMDSV